MRHKASLLRAINERLSDPTLGVSDGMICAVALLAGTEARSPFLQASRPQEESLLKISDLKVMNGNMHDWRTHMAGLMRMIRLRGGFYNLGLDDMTVKVIAAYGPLLYLCNVLF